MAIYEAGAMARPVLASHIGGIPELVVEGQTGLLFEPGNVQQLADGMVRLRRDRRLCRELGRCGREHVEETCGTHYERLLALYAEAAGGRPGDSEDVELCDTVTTLRGNGFTQRRQGAKYFDQESGRPIEPDKVS